MKRIGEIAGKQGAKLRDRSRSVKFRHFGNRPHSGTKGGPNRERLQQGYEKLLSTVGAWWDRPSDFPTRLPKGEAFKRT